MNSLTKKFLTNFKIGFEDMNTQESLYRPTSFWETASLEIVNQIQEFGIDNFRNIPIALSYFVPTYGMPGNGYDQSISTILIEQLEKIEDSNEKQLLSLKSFLSGEQHAFSDYKAFKASEYQSDKSDLALFSESTVGNPVEQWSFDDHNYSRSALNYLLGLSLLKKHIEHDKFYNVLEIGGGFGTLGEILGKTRDNQFKYIDIDIPPTNLVAEYYLSEIFGSNTIKSYSQTRMQTEIQIDSLPSFAVLCPWQIECLRGKIDIFVNFISFQEMEPEVVQNYFQHIQRLEPEFILLRNMREGKQKKTSTTVGVLTPITSDNYIRMLTDYKIVEKNVTPFGYKTVDNYHSEILLFRKCKD